MSNQSKINSIFDRTEEREVGGVSLTFYAPSADYAAKIEQAQMELAKQLRKNKEGEDLSIEAIEAGKVFSRICIEAVLQINSDDAKRLLVVVPSVSEEVNDFLGIGAKANPVGESPTSQ